MKTEKTYTQEFISALAHFETAFKALSKSYDSLSGDGNEATSTNYPFSLSFDEQTIKVINWANGINDQYENEVLQERSNQLKDFKLWIKSDNVFKIDNDHYKTQCTQYCKTFSFSELFDYFEREYLKN